jgi:hypothetical protein
MPMICSSENCFRFMSSVPLNGPDSSSKWRKKRGSRHQAQMTLRFF